jgi:hypothetical protein
VTRSIPPRRFAPRLLSAILALTFTGSLAEARVEFQVLETKDLRLAYVGPTQGFIAPYVAQCFERSMRFYRDRFDYEPSERVNVVLSDVSDFMNASVGVTPRNRMLVHLSPANFVYETSPANERINFLMNHEIAHVVTLDQPAGADRLFRGLFHGKVDAISEHPETMLYGYLTNPRRAASRWYWEGLAVFMETWMAGGLGRAQGPWDEMVFRAMVEDSARFWDPLGLESAGVKTDFQVSVNSYLYGTRFMCYLTWEHGPERLMQWLSRQPGSRAYFASQFERVYGRSLNSAWEEWIAWERGFQRANLTSIHRHPVTGGRDLSRRALGSMSRAFVDSTTRSLVAGVLYPGTVAHLAAISLDDGSVRELQEVKGPALYFVSSLAFDPVERRVFYTTDNDSWRDLVSYDLATGRSRVLIRDARVGDLVFNPVDRSLIGVRHFNGISSVVRLPEPWTKWTRLVSFPYGTDVYDLDVSPDGATLSASVAEISGRQSLRLYAIESLAAGDTASRTLFDFGSSIPQSFVFSEDGRRLYGSSYYTGVSNIFRYDLRADSIDIVTNASTGFFRPIPLRGDSLIAFRYTGAGFVPTLLDAPPLHDVSAITFLGAELVGKYPVLRTWRVPPPSAVKLDSVVTWRGTYRPLASVAPTTVYPIVEAYKDRAAVGLHLNVSDPLFHHAADLSVSHSPDSELPEDERWHAAFGYRHYEWTAKVRYNPASFYDLFGPTKSSRKGVHGSLGYERNLIHDDPRTLDLSVGLNGWTGLERLPDYQNVSTSPGFDKLLSADLSLAYRNLRSSIGAADYEKGVQMGLEGGVNGVRFERAGGSAWRGFPWTAATFDAGTPMPVRNASIWLRTAAGYSPGDPDEPFANFFFGGFGNNWIDRQDPKRYRRYDSFPGVGLNEIGGTNFGRAMLDVNLPPVRFSRLGAMRLYASWARLSVFGGGLVTSMDRASLRRTLGNVGAQADVRLQLLIHQPLTLSFGWGRAFERHDSHDDEWMVSLKIL